MRTLLLPLVLATLAACGEGGNDPAPLAGRYALVSIEGDPIPVFAGSEGSASTWIDAARLDIEAGTLAVDLRRTGGSPASETRTTAYTVSGRSLCPVGGTGCTAAVVKGDTLTLAWPRVVPGNTTTVPWVFVRQ